MPFIHTLLLSIFLFFLSACLSSCGRGKKTAVTEKSLGQLVWSRTVKPDRPALFSPPLFWQTFALRLSLGRHLGFGNANQRKRERGPGDKWRQGKDAFPGSNKARREPLAKTNNRTHWDSLSCYWYAQVEKHRLVFSKKTKDRQREKRWLTGASICSCVVVNRHQGKARIQRALCSCFVAFSHTSLRTVTVFFFKPSLKIETF